MDEPTLIRTFEPAEIEQDPDGLWVAGRCVPFDVVATVSDPPDHVPYQEVFRRGAFRKIAGAANRIDAVLLDFEHQPGIAGVIGHAVELEEHDDGLHGRFKFNDKPESGLKARDLVRDGILKGFSVMFAPREQTISSTATGRLVERTKVVLNKVALCRTPAYPTAEVLAVRRRPPTRPAAFDPELAARIERLGLQLPDTLRVA
jgi:HK97 family phage prohead protease